MNSTSYLQHVAAVTLPLETAIGALINVPVSYLTPDGVQDCFITHSCHGYEFPAGLTQDIYNAAMADEIWTYGAMMNFTSPGGNNMATLAMSMFVQDVMAEINNALYSSGRRFALFAGHDTSVLPFLRAFNVWDGLWPRYASMIRVEIWESKSNQGSFSVRLIYNDKELALPGCGNVSPCPFATFSKIAAKIIASQAECNSVPSPASPRSNNLIFGRERTSTGRI